MATAVKIPSDAVLQHVLDVYERGRTLEALRRAESFAPLHEWAGTRACVLAARLAINCGAPRLALRLAVRARKTSPNDPETLAQFGYEIISRRGPLALWEFLGDWPEESPGVTAAQRAELLALKGVAASHLRDFATADTLVGRAEALAPGRPWIRLQRAYLLECQDRIEEALEVAGAARQLHPHPFYRPAVQQEARLLQLLDRDEDATRLLAEANAALQSGPVAAQWYSLLSENGRWPEAEAALEQFLQLSPLIESRGRQWVAAQRTRVAYHQGRRADAARFASEVDDDFHRAFAANLSRPPVDRERVQLDVTFVRQHFKTCAPATLAALGRFWNFPAEHLQLAEAICYDGTPHWEQRQWAAQNGWFVREFRVTPDSAIALIERGIPFAIVTVETTASHMMALIGFDRARRTLLLRDPGQPYVVEAEADEFLKRYRPFGPHGIVFLPAAERARLDGLVLPDADVCDQYHRFWIALARHDRPAAAQIQQEMELRFAGHSLAWEARFDLAAYDANNTEQARCLDQLLQMFPHNAPRLLRRLACLRDASREERIAFLQPVCAAKDADPALFIELARALEGDARCLPEGRRWLRRAMRARPAEANAISVHADYCWQEGKPEQATELYRFAANLEGHREHLYQAWFAACRRTRRTEQAMTHLQDRFTRFGRRSEQPALTLAWAWREMEQPARARDVLAEAARLRPEDGLLMLRAATLLASLGESAEADRLLASARNKVRQNDWLRAAAEIAEIRQDMRAVLQWSREILGCEPLALEAHGGAVRSLARLEGNAAALAHLKEACAQFPHHYGLQRLLVEWNRDAGPAAVEAAAREVLRVDPADAWARRELALALALRNRGDEAFREAAEGTRIEPRNTYSYSVLGHVHRQRQQLPEARAAFRRAVELSVDNRDAIHALLALADTDRGRREELAFVERELIRQVVQGDGLLAFLELARPVLEPEKLLASLRQAHTERPDLWHVWSALVMQLGHLGQLHEARDLAQQATAKFPHLPRVWLELAEVHRWRNEPDEEIKAAEHAFEMNPAWNPASIALTDALERGGRLDDARRVYERALQHSSRDPQLHACRAHLLWRLRRKEDAFQAVERALRLAPEHEWAWSLLSEWAHQCGEPDRAAAFARTLTTERPGEMRVWLMFARVLTGPGAAEERLAAVGKALSLDPHSTDAWDLKAELLADGERFDEAIAACADGAAACTANVFMLHGRRAWIEARRRCLPEAVRLMRAVLADNANYAWGWSRLAHWLIDQGALVDATTALEQLLHLRPRDPWVHRQLGFLRLKQNDRAGAQKAFDMAVRLTPADACAAQNIFDLQLQAGDLTGAAATLRLMEVHQPGARMLANEILLHLRTNERRASARAFENLCASRDPDPWPVMAAVEGFKRAGRSARALKILKRALSTTACNPQAGAAAVDLLLAQEHRFAAVRLFLRLGPGELQSRAAARLVQGLAAAKSGLLLRWLLSRRREALRSNDAAWGQVGYALNRLDRMREAIAWLADWPSRQHVEPWMLFNLCLALRHVGRCEEATTVARHVLEKWEHRQGAADLRLFLAIEEALAGNIAEAAAQLRQTVARENVAYDEQLLALAKALVAFQQAPPGERANVFKTVRRQLERHFPVWSRFVRSPDARRTLGRAAKVFVRGGAGWRARLWFFWR